VGRFLAARLGPDDMVICYDEYRPGLNFYLRRPVYFVEPPSLEEARIFTSNYIRLHLDEFRRDPEFRLIDEERMRRAIRRSGASTYLLAPRRSFAALQEQAGLRLMMVYQDPVGGVFLPAAPAP
jgi:hypothetical protein